MVLSWLFDVWISRMVVFVLLWMNGKLLVVCFGMSWVMWVYGVIKRLNRLLIGLVFWVKISLSFWRVRCFSMLICVLFVVRNCIKFVFVGWMLFMLICLGLWVVLSIVWFFCLMVRFVMVCGFGRLFMMSWVEKWSVMDSGVKVVILIFCFYCWIKLKFLDFCYIEKFLFITCSFVDLKCGACCWCMVVYF